MRNKVICLILSFIFSVNIISLSFGTYNRLTDTNPEIHKVIEAPIGLSILAAVAWLKANIKKGSYSGSGVLQKPSN